MSTISSVASSYIGCFNPIAVALSERECQVCNEPQVGLPHADLVIFQSTRISSTNNANSPHTHLDIFHAPPWLACRNSSDMAFCNPGDLGLLLFR